MKNIKKIPTTLILIFLFVFSIIFSDSLFAEDAPPAPATTVQTTEQTTEQAATPNTDSKNITTTLKKNRVEERQERAETKEQHIDGQKNIRAGMKDEHKEYRAEVRLINEQTQTQISEAKARYDLTKPEQRRGFQEEVRGLRKTARTRKQELSKKYKINRRSNKKQLRVLRARGRNPGRLLAAGHSRRDVSSRPPTARARARRLVALGSRQRHDGRRRGWWQRRSPPRRRLDCRRGRRRLGRGRCQRLRRHG